MRMIAPEMRAAAFGAGACGGDDKARCNEFVAAAVSFAERVEAVEGARKPGVVADNSSCRFHSPAKLRARRVSERGGDVGGGRRPVRLRCVIAQSGSDSVREDHGFQL
jgi:hypothetical protein